MTVQEKARQLSEAFEKRTRPDDSKFTCLKDGSPEWMTEVIHAAHGDRLPDDFMYQFCENAADAIAESEDPEEAVYEMEASIYYGELTAWLADHTENMAYVDEILGDRANEDGFQLLAAAQQKCKEEVAGIVLAELTKLVEEDDE